jgi:hypothetical protein
LLVSGRRLDASFFKNYQELKAEDFEQQQGGKRQVLFTVLSYSYALPLFACS